MHTRHTGKEVLDARFPIGKMEKETESEAPPSSIKKRRCGYKKDWENEYLWLKGVEGIPRGLFVTFAKRPSQSDMEGNSMSHDSRRLTQCRRYGGAFIGRAPPSGH